MNKATENIRKQAAKLLQDKEVEMVIGYGLGSEAIKTQPVFITSPDDVDKLVWSPFCANGLTKYLSDLKTHPGKIAVCVKGCDSRGVYRMTQDKIIPRDKVYVIGVPCAGIVDYAKLVDKMDPSGELKDVEVKGDTVSIKTSKGDFSFKTADVMLDKCAVCEHHNPVVSDFMADDKVDLPSVLDSYEEIKKFEAMSPEEKTKFWLSQFDRCIRCYACRNACPGCTCRECVFDNIKPDWVGKEVNVAENELFHLTRAFHLAGRCVECGECDRVCPVNIPLRLLNKKLLKDARELFNTQTPGSTEEGGSVFNEYRLEDPEEFM